jgi:hypothetical protein
LGTSHKDVERAMLSVLNDRRDEYEESEGIVEPSQATIDAIIPKKIKSEPEFERPSRYRTLTLEEVQYLLQVSDEPIKAETQPESNLDYPTYSMEEASRLVREHMEYKEEEMKKEKVRWALQKMTE